MKRIILSLLLGWLAVGNAWAANTADAQALVQNTAEQMIQALKAKRDEMQQNPDRIYDLVRDIVVPHFDFETIARWVLGRHWRSATPEQRRQFTEEFRNLMVRTYAKALLDYSDETLDYMPLQAPADAEEVTVRSEVERTQGPAIPINYELHYRNGAWLVYDVNIDGVSLVTNYRSSIGSQIGREGLEAVIAKLKERNGTQT